MFGWVDDDPDIGEAFWRGFLGGIGWLLEGGFGLRMVLWVGR